MNKLPSVFKKINNLEKLLKSKSENYWIERGQRHALELFKLMSKRVPAYKDFLKKNKVNPRFLNKISDFKNIPPIDKNNYLRNYPLESLCWDGNLKDKRWTISTNSGSTGEPFYFPREKDHDDQYALLAELYLRDNFEIQKKSTLYLDCFAMGAWIGGLFTYEAIRIVAERGKYPLSIYTPGIFKDEIFKAIKTLGPKFDQVIIGGYPPFTKDIVDEGRKYGIDWKKYKLGFVFSAEGFTEEFRDYIFRKTRTKNYFKGSLNHYGTADMGTMAYETPISILIRKLANGNSDRSLELFGENNRLPTLTQYFPELFYFEEVNNVLYCSGYSGLPFVRYDLKDYGGILGFGEMKNKLSTLNIDLEQNARERIINCWKLPFVFLYERKDFVVKLYGANIFPDSIRHALQQRKFEKKITSKFTMGTQFNENQNQYLEINVELKKGKLPSRMLEKEIQKEIVKYLLLENSEYTSNYKSLPERQTPKILLRSYEFPDQFKSVGKHKWIKK